MKKRIANIPWVFWFTVEFRPKWFKMFWKTRGANFTEIQFLYWKISIGMPWLNSYLSFPDYYDENIHETNKENLKARFSILVNEKI